MAFESVNYQCPACGGPLHLASAEQKLVCDYCDSRFEVEEVEALYRERQDKADAKADAAAAAPKPAAAFAGGTKVLCPMPGTIVAVNVKEGDAVKSGQALFSLEAMKMESDIPAPVDGIVRGIAVRKGDATEAGGLLCSIE